MANDLPKLVGTRPVRESPDDRRVVGRIRALEAVAQPDGRRRLDRVDEDDGRLGDAELPACLGQCVEGRLDILRIRVGDSHPIGLDVHAQARQAAELWEGFPADGKGRVRGFEGHWRDGDAWFHSPIMRRVSRDPDGRYRSARPMPTYPLIPKTTAHLRPGQFWSIPMADGRFGCGRVLRVDTDRRTGGRTRLTAA